MPVSALPHLFSNRETTPLYDELGRPRVAHPVPLGKQGFFATLRRDKWWVEPALVASILTAFGIYATISAVLWHTHFEVGPYLSPLYEPILKPSWWPFSPAVLILWAPLGFRGTCYYYRGA